MYREATAMEVVNVSDAFVNTIDKDKAAMALQAVWDYHALYAPLREDEVRYVQGIKHLIKETGRVAYMLDLGLYYAKKEKHDLAYRYWKMAADLGDQASLLCLGDMWYEGQFVERDYKKAFEMFNNISRCCQGSILRTKALVRMAKMWRDGKGVPMDLGRYREMMKKLEHIYRTDHVYQDENSAWFATELLYLLAEYKIEEDEIEEAVSFLELAKKTLIKRSLEKTPSGSEQKWMEKVTALLYTLERRR